ncbi:MAG TPA: hypothetical protein VK747_16270, partial [Blastocatellia bacterium]|nr:hypothetical protein [Blastocatellia bacterium]
DALDEPGGIAALRPEIIGLSIAQRLLTPFTAFVAVDSEVTEKSSDKQTRVSIAVPLPEGLNMEGFLDASMICGAPMAAAPMLARARSSRSDSGPANLLKRARSFVREAMASPDAAEMEAAYLMDMSEQARVGASSPSSERVASQLQTTDELLRWLARIQNVSGSWGAGKTEVEQTAAAILAFVRAGHTHRAGHYRRQLAKAIKWLLAAKAQGPAEYARAQALAELAVATGDASIAKAAELSQTAVPATVLNEPLSTLDELRVAALTRQIKEVAPTLLSGSQADLARVWMAALLAGQ